MRNRMNPIDSCKADLEKILGFPVIIKMRHAKSNWYELKMENLYFIKDEQNPVHFRVDMRHVPEPNRDNNWYNGWISEFNLQQFPACCGILLSTKSSVYHKFRGKGVATRLNAFRKAIAHHEGYSLLICTDVASNSPQNKVLAKNGWKDVHTFVNSRTGNTLNISVSEVLRPHTFSLVSTGKESSVKVMGDYYNDYRSWKHGQYLHLKDGVWSTTVFIPPGNGFQYKFQVNGTECITDPQNPHLVDNGLGGLNSFVPSEL